MVVSVTACRIVALNVQGLKSWRGGPMIRRLSGKGSNMKMGLMALAAAMLAGAGCAKSSEDASGPLQKVATPAKGLPTAEAPGAAMAGGQVHAGGVQGDMPDDENHRRTRAGGMGGMGGMGAMSAHGEVDASQLDDHPLPLRLTGLGSAWELQRALKALDDEGARARFEEAFRLTFCADKAKRDLVKAQQTFEDLLRGDPKLAQAYRGLAYVTLSQNFNIAGATEMYDRALAVHPDYGEVHYALAFLYAGGDQAKGAEHLKRALELGIADENGLKSTYGLQ